MDLFNDDSELVGIESPREQIIEMLMQGRHTDKQQLQVVSIYGIGGLGKTTIARSVYRQISNRFECCAQVSVSERPDIVGIMKSIIDQVRRPYSSMEEFSNMQDNLQVITNVLKEFLEDKRYSNTLGAYSPFILYGIAMCTTPSLCPSRMLIEFVSNICRRSSFQVGIRGIRSS